MILWPEGPLLPLFALSWPLLLGALAALPPLRANAMRLLPFAPLPALYVALGELSDAVTSAPFLLLGAVLGLDGIGALLLGMTAGIWLAAGIYAQDYMRSTPRPAVFAGFWCLTLTGNLGVFMAQDIVTFYVSFAAVSLAAYFLVVEDGTEKALRAGRIYIVLAVLGEAALLVAFTIGAAAAGSLMVAEVREALGDSPLGGLAVWLLVLGFGLKAGLMPLHLWLPIAHPAAPTPASAVLSGAIVQAGVIGLILFLPAGTHLGPSLLLIGFFTAFAGALLGLTQDDPKAVLAYSTISQMGLVAAIIGAAVQAGTGMGAAAFYAFHHGLAKAALFLCVGIASWRDGRWTIAVRMLALLAALSVAGAPLTGGALAKAAAKPGLAFWAEVALTLSAGTTTLLMAWFLYRLGAKPAAHSAERPQTLAVLPAFTLVLAALVLPWFLWAEWTGLPPAYPLRLPALWAMVWPMLIGAVLVALAAWRGWRPLRLPQGDIAPFLETVAEQAVRRFVRTDWNASDGLKIPPALLRLNAAAGRAADLCEAALLKWRWSGLGLLLLALSVAGLSAL